MTKTLTLVDNKIDHLEVAREVLTNESESLLILKDSLDGTFNQVIDRILETSGRVVVTGMGKSGHVARKIAATFASTGQPSLFVHPAEASHGDMGMITQLDIVIALSNSGETAELANIIDYTRRFSIPLIAMTRRSESTLNRHADYSLLVPEHPEACPMGLAPTTSTTMMLALGDALAVSLLKARSFSAAEFKLFHPGGSLGGKLQKVSDRMHTGDLIPLVNATERMDQVIIAISQKGFGCVGVVDDSGDLLGVITDGDLRRHMGDTILNEQAQNIMTKNPTTIDGQMLMTEALALMNHKKITSFFIVDHNKPIGIIHIHDFLRAGVV